MPAEKNQPLIFEQSRKGRTAYSLPALDVPETPVGEWIPADYLRQDEPDFPEVSELQLVRHYTALSRRNFGVDNGFYPLGSCTMKYNPKVNEKVARLSGFNAIHPLQDEQTVQGALELLYRLQTNLEAITGMDAMTLQPAAGAHGEWTGLRIIKAFHGARKDIRRTKVIIPDTAHGTNPASASVAGFDTVTVKSDANGLVDLEDLKRVADDQTAALMLTNPNTLGLFETHIQEIAEIVHAAGGKVYYDGANMNAIMGLTRPGDMGYDVVHLNLHKTFTGPHGGGGPGSGPVGVKKELAPFLPKPLIIRHPDGSYGLDDDRPQSIGRVKAFFGNFGINVRAYAYIRTMGPEGLRQVSRDAVLNANYLKKKLSEDFEMPFSQFCKHEFVLSGSRQKALGVRTLDMAKRLLDFGYYPPTIYFPLIVDEAMMIEPTETESKETLDAFAEHLITISHEAEDDPKTVQSAPHTTVVARLDETRAARHPVLRFKK
ncbi:aminomethyl-transferring glycine dehydrogenase subunit GcvPB [Sporolactobacillus vineae]|uniref:aminomethyl-transferring glycine dehydrogenase subunit GcvPB n=1 Tax=Sporolactobacillus vineae TaxID=444463 RepID=UPI0002889D6C|nr:aminomethyl-transferring glycine dehydrogenase subunit GcvPB [Sporolactobacillus vineae]